ncbi:methyltransferase domain-containing protein [Candidatus Entotheonella palauensis]|uniref:methyltransferase domain-containing protein n=1 Tax=Candidatus Entotheonella palauensis TaxID=93172 RepID=UPI0015C48C9C|nr:methyltransferase domain-containing protein [Candidatus Entotheonella palauensis]
MNQQTVPVNLPCEYGGELPPAIATLQIGQTVLDLGSSDSAYRALAATAVGEDGHIISVETTPAVVARARQHVMQDGFFNVSFRLGELEYLPVADQTVDVIISHYGLQPSSVKTQVFREALRALKPGGHLALVAMVATQVLPEEMEENDGLDTDDLSDVLMLDDIEDMLRAAGFDQIKSQTTCCGRGARQASTMNGIIEDLVTPVLIEAAKPA